VDDEMENDTWMEYRTTVPVLHENRCIEKENIM